MNATKSSIALLAVALAFAACGKTDLKHKLIGAWETVGVKCTEQGACEKHADPLTIEFRTDGGFVLEGNRLSYALSGRTVTVPLGENVMRMDILSITDEEMLAKTTSSLGLTDIEKYRRTRP